MDLKTVVYMEERVSKARGLMGKIDHIDKNISAIKEATSFYTIEVGKQSDCYHEWTHRNILPNSSYSERVFDTVRPALLSAYTQIRNELQNELDNL